MPSNIFATTGTSVSVIFLDKTKKYKDVLLVDASKLGLTVKDGKNQKTILSDEEEDQIINAFKEHKSIDAFSQLVSFDEIKNKDYSFSAGQYFEIKINHVDINFDEFSKQMLEHQTSINKLFRESSELGSLIDSQLAKIKYD
jgi:type I restriction enzyme M protein